MKKNLIDQAKDIKYQYQTKTSKVITQEEIELAAAWARGEITSSATSIVLGLQRGTNTYVFLAMALREYIKQLSANK